MTKPKNNFKPYFPPDHLLHEEKVEYKGEMRNGIAHGNGAEYINGKKAREGTFKDGLLEGKGREYSYIYEHLIYEGEFKKGRRHGYGISYFHTGTTQHEGNWKDGLKHGKGIEYRIDGTLFCEGEWKKGGISSLEILMNEGVTK